MLDSNEMTPRDDALQETPDRAASAVAPAKLTRRRNVLKAAGAVALGAVQAPAVLAQQKTLRFLNNDPSLDTVRVLRVAAAEYERATGVRVIIESVPAADVFAKLQASIAVGKPYDISGLIFVAHVVLLAEAGKLVPLNSLIQKHKWGPRILVSMKGQEYWYPYHYAFNWMLYRKDLYQQKGLRVPTTMDQMVENAKALTDGKRFGAMHPIGSNGAGQWMSVGYMWAEGVRLLDDDFGLALEAPEMRRRYGTYLDFMKRLMPYMPPGMLQAGFLTAVNQYSGDQIAMAPWSAGLIEIIDRSNPELAAKTGSFPFPDSAGKSVGVTNGYKGWVVVDTPMREESLKFMDWFAETHYVNWLHARPLNHQPPRLDIYDDARWRAHPTIEKYAETVEFQRSLLTRKDVIIRSIDTEGPRPDVRAGRLFESFGVMEGVQNRLLKDMPAGEATDLAIQKLRTALV